MCKPILAKFLKTTRKRIHFCILTSSSPSLNQKCLHSLIYCLLKHLWNANWILAMIDQQPNNMCLSTELKRNSYWTDIYRHYEKLDMLCDSEILHKFPKVSIYFLLSGLPGGSLLRMLLNGWSSLDSIWASDLYLWAFSFSILLQAISQNSPGIRFISPRLGCSQGFAALLFFYSLSDWGLLILCSGGSIPCHCISL